MAFTNPNIFIITHTIKFHGFPTNIVELAKQISTNLTDTIVVIDNNFIHNAMPGYKFKVKKEKKIDLSKKKKKERQVQGDSTCFNNSIELKIKLNHPKIPVDKLYHLKCFPATGEAQITGGIFNTGEDADIVVSEVIKFFNNIGIQLTYTDYMAKMINYKFKYTGTQLIDIENTINYMEFIRRYNITTDDKMEYHGQDIAIHIKPLKYIKYGDKELIDIENIPDSITEKKREKINNLILDSTKPPPIIFIKKLKTQYNVYHLKSSDEISEYIVNYDLHKAEYIFNMNELVFPNFQVVIVVPYIVDPTLLTVKVILDNRQPRIKLFQSGKVNVLGMPSYDHICHIYEFMNQLYTKNIDILTYIPLQKD